MEALGKQIVTYQRSDGTIPFEEWLKSLRDLQAKNRIQVRIKRAIAGNLGDYRSVGEGVFELRIDYGPGYRIYFGQIGQIIVIILCGGDKNSQDRDIFEAKSYWREYHERIKDATN